MRPGRRSRVAARAAQVAGAAAGLLLVTACGAGAEGPSTPDETPAAPVSDLSSPATKEIAMQLVSSAENSSLDWRAQYAYLEDIDDGRGYTGGIIGFTSGTGDMLELVEDYTDEVPGNPLAAYVPALEAVDGSDSHDGLGRPFEQAWQQASTDPAFTRAQDRLRDRVYFDPAVRLARDDGLGALGQFAYYDAAVVHGPGEEPDTLGGIRRTAREAAATPADGGDEAAYLRAFLAARTAVMEQEEAHEDVSRVTGAQARFLDEGNLALRPPLRWEVYGDPFEITG